MKFTYASIKEVVKNRTVYIYAANLEGLGISKLFRRLGFKVGGILDTRTFNGKNTIAGGLPIINPDDFFNKYNSEESFILMASKHRATKKIVIEYFYFEEVRNKELVIKTMYKRK